jgi:hypothetical protein
VRTVESNKWSGTTGSSYEGVVSTQILDKNSNGLPSSCMRIQRAGTLAENPAVFAAIEGYN